MTLYSDSIFYAQNLLSTVNSLVEGHKLENQDFHGFHVLSTVPTPTKTKLTNFQELSISSQKYITICYVSKIRMEIGVNGKPRFNKAIKKREI